VPQAAVLDDPLAVRIATGIKIEFERSFAALADVTFHLALPISVNARASARSMACSIVVSLIARALRNSALSVRVLLECG